MPHSANILFVCTGNVFRSMSAEFAARRAGLHTPYIFQSAGTHAAPEITAMPYVGTYLNQIGLDVAGHTSRRLDRDILSSANLVIAMAENHLKFIDESFNVRSLLFMDVATGQKTTLPDVGDVIADHTKEPERANAHIALTIDTIISNANSFVQNLPHYLK
jgi:protein-tyrosine phosphatase